MTWSSPILAEQYTGTNLLTSALQTENTTIWLAWQSDRSGNQSIYLKTLTPGRGWSFTTNLTSSRVNSSPTLNQLPNSTILVFWAGNETGHFNIYYRSFNDLGHRQAWSEKVQLTNTTTADDSLPSTALGADGTLWLVWTRQVGGSDQLYVKTMKNNVWSQEIQLTTDSNLNFASSVVVGPDGIVRVVWSKGPVSGNPQIYLKTFNGVVWSGETPIVTSALEDFHPSIMQSRDGNFWVFWTRVTPSGSGYSYKIWAKYSVDNGQTWPASTEAQLTQDPTGRTSIDEYPASIQSADHTLWVFYSTNSVISSEFDIYGLQSSPINQVHDVAVTRVTTSRAWTYPGGIPSAGVSNIVTAYVTVSNLGDFLENVTITTQFSNGTLVYTPPVRSNNPVVPGGSITISFNWNTTAAKPARYALTASINPLPLQSVGNVGHDHLFVRNSIWMLPPGDVDQDGSVTMSDLSVFFYNYGFAVGSNHNGFVVPPWVDLHGTGVVDIVDLGIASNNYDTFT